jgi:hypothetical protein
VLTVCIGTLLILYNIKDLLDEVFMLLERYTFEEWASEVFIVLECDIPEEGDLTCTAVKP